MPKISSLIETTTPNESGQILGFPPASIDYKTYLAHLANGIGKAKMPPAMSDLISSLYYPFTPAAIGGGTYAGIEDETNHPGVVRISGQTSTGAVITLGGLTAVLIGGLEVAEFIVRWKLVLNTVMRLGFFDTVGTGVPVDRVEFVHSAGTVKGACSNNSASTLTVTAFTPVVNTWYRLRIEVNADASLVTFYIYDCATGALMWSDTVSSNIPTAAGRETGFGVLAYKTTAGVVSLLDVDYMQYYIDKELTR